MDYECETNVLFIIKQLLRWCITNIISQNENTNDCSAKAEILRDYLINLHDSSQTTRMDDEIIRYRDKFDEIIKRFHQSECIGKGIVNNDANDFHVMYVEISGYYILYKYVNNIM